MTVEMSKNNLDQYNQQSNVEIQGIPTSISDDSLEDKVINTFKLANIITDKSDIDDYLRFANHRIWLQGLSTETFVDKYWIKTLIC